MSLGFLDISTHAISWVCVEYVDLMIYNAADVQINGSIIHHTITYSEMTVQI